jgi:hypothetical protein
VTEFYGTFSRHLSRFTKDLLDMASYSRLIRLGLIVAATSFTVASCAAGPVDTTVDTPAVQETSSAGINADLCDEKNYTAQVENLACSDDLATFSSTGLPSPSAILMVGITATNQQYARPHD